MSNSTKRAFPYKQSYWMMNQPFEKSPALAGEHNTDVVVIGGGYAGLATALGLIEQQPDLRVTIIEAKHIGYGASGRNGGHILNVPPMAWLLSDLSKEKNVANVHLSIEMAAEQVRKICTLLQKENIDIEIETEFVAPVARSSVQVALIRWFHSVFQSVGLGSQFSEGEAARSRTYDYPGYPAKAVLSLPTKVFHPFKLAQGLRTALMRRGVSIFEYTAATSIESTPQGVTVWTPEGVVQAQRAVLSTNAYIAQNEVSLDATFPKTSFTHTYMMATEQLSDEHQKLIAPAGEGIGDASLVFFYGRLHDNRLLFGGVDRKSKNKPDEDRHEESYRALYSEMLRRFPYLSETPLYAAWGGAVQQTTFETPITRRVGKHSNIILNNAFGGNGGVNQSLLSGRLTPALVLEKSDDTDALHIISELERSQFPLMGVARAGVGVMGAFLRNLF
jgi:glycine/D-amino acid oxidase-like deaminating enzyme